METTDEPRLPAPRAGATAWVPSDAGDAAAVPSPRAGDDAARALADALALHGVRSTTVDAGDTADRSPAVPPVRSVPAADSTARRAPTARGGADAVSAAPDLHATGLGTPGTPGTPSFSADGRWWWDGERWSDVSGDARTPAGARGRRIGGRTAAAVLVGLGACAAVSTAVVLAPSAIDRRPPGLDTQLQEALLVVHAAQTAYLAQQDAYTADLTELETFSGGVLGVTGSPPVEVVVVSASAEGFCLGGGVLGGAPTAWMTEAGETTDTPCT